MKGKNVLVTGALGFIGRHLCQALEKEGARLIKADNCTNSRPEKGDKFWYADVHTRPFYNFMLGHSMDYVFHFGGPCSVLQFNVDPVGYMYNTVTGFSNILQLAKLKGAKLIYPSSGNVYGLAKLPHGEKREPKPNNLYGVGKLICEQMAGASSVDSVGLRIFTGYGPGEGRKVTLASIVYHFLDDVMGGRNPVIWGDGEQRRDCIFIDDIVKIMISVAKNSESPRIMNVGTGRDYSYKEIVNIIGDVVGVDVVTRFEDKPANYVDRAVADVTLMKKFVDFEPIGLEEGITKFYDYLRKD